MIELTTEPVEGAHAGRDRSLPILVGYDGSAPSERALRWAFAEAEHRGTDLTVLQSWHEPILSEQTWLERWDDPAGEERAATETLRAAIVDARTGHTGVAWVPLLVGDRPAPALIEASANQQLVVVGSRGHGGFAGLALGSVAEHVAAAASAAVVVVRDAGADDGPIIVGVDGSSSSRTALRWAVAEGRTRGTPVRAVLAWNALVPVGAHGAEPLRATATPADARITLHQILREELGEAAGDVHGEAVSGTAAGALVEASRGSAMVVVGAPAHGGRPHDLGEVARQVLRHATCPVVIAR